jgi:hypothetical protein
MREPIWCRSFEDVVLALGGNEGVAEIIGCSPNAVCNWKATGQFPPKHYAVIAMALYDQGFYAPWNLFHFSGIDRDAA